MNLPRPLAQLHLIAAWRLLWVGPAFPALAQVEEN